MQFHQLKPEHSSKRKKRVGRGGKRGTYSGKGMKGQLARSGRKLRPELRDIIKKIPKKRGYRFSPRAGSIEVALGILEKKFGDGATISKETLIAQNIISVKKSKTVSVKVLGKAALKKKFTLTGLHTSQGVRDAVEKAGGSVK